NCSDNLTLCRVRIRADLVRLGHQLVGAALFEAGEVGVQPDAEGELTPLALADADPCGDVRVADVHARVGSGGTQCAVEAGGVAGREKLLRVGVPTTFTAQLRGYGELLVEYPVRGQHLAIAAVALGRRLRCVERFH